MRQALICLSSYHLLPTLSSPSLPMPTLSSLPPPIPALLSPPSPMPALSPPLPLVTTSSYVPMSSLSCPLVSALSRPPVPALSSPPPLMANSSSCPIPALLSCSVLAQAPTHLPSLNQKTFNKALSDELLVYHRSTSPSFLCPFPTLCPLPKQSFDIAFINSRPIAENHAAKEVDLSFGECACLVPVKCNWS